MAKHAWLYPCLRISELLVRSSETNTEYRDVLPRLRGLFGIFPSLGQIYIKSESDRLISLFPAPAGVEACLLQWQWEMKDSSNIVTEEGIEKGQIRFAGWGGGEIEMDFERDATGIVSDRVIKCRLLDTILKPEEEVIRYRKVSTFPFRTRGVQS